MNLTKVFEMQKSLRQTIKDNHHLEQEDLLPNFLLALRTELGELANAWRGFKHWSTNKTMDREAALEEYADNLSFILEIGLELQAPQYLNPRSALTKAKNLTEQFNLVFIAISDLEINIRFDTKGIHDEYNDLFLHFIHLGQMLGFTDQKIEDAYIHKNKINFQRQEDGY